MTFLTWAEALKSGGITHNSKSGVHPIAPTDVRPTLCIIFPLAVILILFLKSPDKPPEYTVTIQPTLRTWTNDRFYHSKPIRTLGAVGIGSFI